MHFCNFSIHLSRLIINLTLDYPSFAGKGVCATGVMYEISHCSLFHQHGDTALHQAAREDKASCVKALLSHPGIDINIRNNEGHTAMMVAKYTSLGVFKQVVKTCSDFPADSYGKVVLCGNSGAGKSTLTQVGCTMGGILSTSAFTQLAFLHVYSID